MKTGPLTNCVRRAGHLSNDKQQGAIRRRTQALCPLPLFWLGSEFRFIWPNFAFGSVKLKKLYWRSVVDDEGDRNTLRWTVRLYQYFLARDGSPNVINNKGHVRHRKLRRGRP